MSTDGQPANGQPDPATGPAPQNPVQPARGKSDYVFWLLVLVICLLVVFLIYKTVSPIKSDGDGGVLKQISPTTWQTTEGPRDTRIFYDQNKDHIRFQVDVGGLPKDKKDGGPKKISELPDSEAKKTEVSNVSVTQKKAEETPSINIHNNVNIEKPEKPVYMGTIPYGSNVSILDLTKKMQEKVGQESPMKDSVDADKAFRSEPKTITPTQPAPPAEPKKEKVGVTTPAPTVPSEEKVCFVYHTNLGVVKYLLSEMSDEGVNHPMIIAVLYPLDYPAVGPKNVVLFGTLEDRFIWNDPNYFLEYHKVVWKRLETIATQNSRQISDNDRFSPRTIKTIVEYMRTNPRYAPSEWPANSWEMFCRHFTTRHVDHYRVY